MRILVACEESQAVCIELRNRGHEAFSCDIFPCSGGHPEWHIQEDVLKHLADGWDMMIAFPPCTHLASSGRAWFEQKRKDGRQQKGIDLFMAMINAPIEKIAVENPIGIMSTLYRKPDQIIQPYYFGDEAQKTTCLWLKNLPKLYHNANVNLFDNNITHVKKGEFFKCVRENGKVEYRPKWNESLPPSKDRAKLRSKTFPGIAIAMAEQWSGNITNTIER